MPVTERGCGPDVLFQRQQYSKGGIGRAYWDYRDDIVLSLLDRGDQDILDLGCGEGITLQKLIARFPERRVLGIDALEENIEICGKFGLPAKKGNAYALDLPGESMDAVLFLEVVEHLEAPGAALADIWRVLRPAGKLVTVFPNDRAFKMARIMTLKLKEAYYDPGHIKQWTPAEMRTTLLRQGFKVYSVRCVPFLLWVISLHCVVAARKEGG